MSERLRCEFMFTSKRRCANTAVTNGLCLYHGSIDALCARHGITVEGIVALVDEVMTTSAPYPYNAISDRAYLRRLVRGEEA